MALDTSIALNANAPQPANPLATALQVAQFRAYNANGLAAQQGLDANRAISKAYQQATDPTTGQVDNNKLMAIISQDPAAGFKLGEVVQGINTQKQQQQTLARGDIALSNDQLDSAQKHLGWAYQTAGAIANNPNATTDDVMKALSAAIQNKQITPQVAAQAIADMPGADSPKGALQQWAANHVAQAAGTAQQLGIMLPKTGSIDKGDKILLTNTNPVSGDVSQTGSINKGIDPVTATSPVSVYDPATGTNGIAPRGSLPGFGGADSPPPLPSSGPTTPNGPDRTYLPGQTPQPAAGAPKNFVPTGPAMGVQDSNAGTVKTMNDHWDSLSGAATNAQRNIGIANNIQHLADTANTGFGSDRKATVNGILAAVGIKSSGDTATDNDLLNKYVAQLNISSLPGGTDAAKALQSAATPGAKMQPEAIKQAAQYIVGVNQMALAQQKYLQSYKLNNDAAGYTQAKTAFDQNADPRIWAWASMQDPAKRAAYAKQLQSQDPGIVGKIQTLEHMGIIK
ncbi:hypothetical protein [Caballeronia sp. NCTM1]|uniref:hypothetical protein n=1 Tax=Caballeronia sp. NCTM1 TaxID=2921753 RepID=UPI0020289256|nr:hypothetical protein [Caballeronia sp. NCTM1]